MMRSFIKSLIFLLLPLLSQTQITIHPQPQHIALSGQYVKLAPSYRIIGNMKQSERTIRLLQTIVTLSSDSNAMPISFSTLNASDQKLQRSGAYVLSLSPQQISVQAYDERGLYYALQTLSQMLHENENKGKTFPIGTVTDYPDVAYRGTVEGFYGQPWSHQDRLEQLRFYGKLKLNVYIYGPKDDPYHSSPHWRDAYPLEAETKMRELVQEAHNNEVDFVWSIHPGKDIQWNRADSQAVLHKFEKMYGLGVRSFAVFFDDISGSGTDARKQAGLLNYIQREFIESKGDVLPLIMCPTEYNRGWANKTKGSYLDILGEHLHPAVMVMWTGNTVVADITKEGQQWVNNRIRRPSFVWWNFPVSDYVRDHLLLGPAYGLDTNIAHEMSGFVSNPMDKSEASKPAIFSIAAYAWNMKSYDAVNAWKAALQYIMPEAYGSFQLFSSHNSDPGPNGHRYRRYESAHIQPAADSFLQAYENGVYDKKVAKTLENEFKRMLPVSAAIQKESKNKLLVEQLQPWLLQFDLLARSGMAAMQMAKNWEEKKKAIAWQHYLQLSHLLDSMQTVDKTMNQNPYQPGVETGSLVLTPLVQKLHRQAVRYLASNGKSEPSSEVMTVNSHILTNVTQLQYQPLQSTNASLAITPVLEVLQVQPQTFAGITVHPHLQVDSFQFHLTGSNLSSWAQFEKSTDGKQWEIFTVAEKNGKGEVAFFDSTIRAVRVKNISEKVQSVNLRQFKLLVNPVSTNGMSVFALDGSITTKEMILSERPLTISLPEKYQLVPITFLMQTGGAHYTITGITEKGIQKRLYRGNKEWVVLKKLGKRKVTELQITTESNRRIILYEIMPQQP